MNGGNKSFWKQRPPKGLHMCCWLILAFAFAPRVALVFMWLLTDRLSAAFGGILLPLLGFFVLPWTTLMYALVAPGGIGGLDIVILVIAIAADVGSWGGGYRYRGRD